MEYILKTKTEKSEGAFMGKDFKVELVSKKAIAQIEFDEIHVPVDHFINIVEYAWKHGQTVADVTGVKVEIGADGFIDLLLKGKLVASLVA